MVFFIYYIYEYNYKKTHTHTHHTLLCKKSVTCDAFYFYRLWVHEVMRVFYDRLIDDKDREWLFNDIRLNVNTNFQESFDVLFNNLSDSSVRNTA